MWNTENPAEWLLEITSSAVLMKPEINWPDIWTSSTERLIAKDSLEVMKSGLAEVELGSRESQEFAKTFPYQLFLVTRRNIEHNWQTPSYLYSKLFLTAGAVSATKIPKFTRTAKAKFYTGLGERFLLLQIAQ